MKKLSDLKNIDLGIHPVLEVQLIGEYIGFMHKCTRYQIVDAENVKLLRIFVRVTAANLLSTEIQFDLSIDEYNTFIFDAGLNSIELFTFIFDKIIEAKNNNVFYI